MKNLQLKFKSSEGANKSISLDYASENLDEKTVREAMQQIADANVFEKNTEVFYQTPLSAKYIETNETNIFTTAPVAK